MSTAVTTAKSLEERVREKLHEQIGDLITPDDIKAIVERGIEEALFQPHSITEGSGYHQRTVNVPSLAQKLVEEQLEKQMQAAVEAWIRENSERVEAMIQATLNKGAGEVLVGALDARIGHVFRQAADNLRMMAGLPPGQY